MYIIIIINVLFNKTIYVYLTTPKYLSFSFRFTKNIMNPKLCIMTWRRVFHNIIIVRGFFRKRRHWLIVEAAVAGS